MTHNQSAHPVGLSRRSVVRAGALPALTAEAVAPAVASSRAGARTLARPAAPGLAGLRQPDSLPAPSLPAGTDTIPRVEHIVVVMMENHSYDNHFGMLRRAGADGFRLGWNGKPLASNPYPDGRVQHAFRMPTTCQLDGHPAQDWLASHTQYAGG